MRVRSLTPSEARVVLSLEEEHRSEVSLREIERRADVSPAFARKLAHQLVEKRWLQRVRPGIYLLNPSSHGPEAIPDTDPFRAGSHLVDPYYFGFATAAELHGLHPQMGRVYYVVTPRRRIPSIAHAARFRAVHCAPNRFFGRTMLVRRGESLQVSDIERTVLDCLERPELVGGFAGAVRVLQAARSRIRWAKLAGYARRLGSRSTAARIGFLSEALLPRLPIPPDWHRNFGGPSGPAYVPLGPPREFGRRGGHDARWRIIRNVPGSLLRSEVEVR